MASQEERLEQWRSAANTPIRRSFETQKRKRGPRPKRSGPAKGGAYRGRLLDAAEKGVARHDAWLKDSAGYVEAEAGEKTFEFRQQDIAKAIPVGAARKAFELNLPELGPYSLDYSRNGRHLLIGGRKGHLAEFDWQSGRLLTEIQVGETVRDVKFLHSYMYWAAAQKKYVYIYDHSGIELHRLKSMHEPYCLEFLPHHFLLCSTGNVGVLTWQDTTSGQVVASHPTGKGCCRVMRQNPWNAVLCLGHSFGSVSLWTPNFKAAVAQIKCHRTAISALAVDPSGRYLATASPERLVKVWDVRKFDALHCYCVSKTPDAVSISQTGLLAVSYGTRVEIWKDALAQKQQKPYLVHTCTGNRVSALRFCPYEDVLGVGHAKGLRQMLVPGSGEANYDSFVADPFQTRKGRRESEVTSMLDKLPPEMIAFDPDEISRVKNVVFLTLPKYLAQIRSEMERKAEVVASEDEDSDDDVPLQRALKKPRARPTERAKPENVPFTLRRFFK